MLRRVLLVAALGLVLATSASASTAAPAFYGCQDTGALVRPKTIVVACGDGNFSIVNIIWSRWASRSAAGRGAAHVNDCVPNCAAGTFHIYRGVAVRLTRPKLCSDGKRLFTRIGWTFTKHKPLGVNRHSLEKAPFWTKPHCP